MKLRSAVRLLAETSRRHGLRAGAQLSALAVARRALTFERSYLLELTEPPRASAGADRLTRLATAQDIRELALDPIWDLNRDAVRLLSRGHRCVLNVVDGSIAGYAWMNPHRLVVPRLRAAFSLNPGEAHIYKGLTHPAYRGQQLGVDRFAFWLTELPDEGRPRRLLTDFAFDNFSTLARAAKTGLTRVGSGTFVAAGGRERRWLSPELSARSMAPVPADLPHHEH